MNKKISRSNDKFTNSPKTFSLSLVGKIENAMMTFSVYLRMQSVYIEYFKCFIKKATDFWTDSAHFYQFAPKYTLIWNNFVKNLSQNMYNLKTEITV